MSKTQTKTTRGQKTAVPKHVQAQLDNIQLDLSNQTKHIKKQLKQQTVDGTTLINNITESAEHRVDRVLAEQAELVASEQDAVNDRNETIELLHVAQADVMALSDQYLRAQRHVAIVMKDLDNAKTVCKNAQQNNTIAEEALQSMRDLVDGVQSASITSVDHCVAMRVDTLGVHHGLNAAGNPSQNFRVSGSA